MLSLEDQILVAIRRITRAVDLRSRVLLQDFGLTVPQLAILSTIQRLQPVAAGRIAREVHLGQPTVTGVLNRLEGRGLIARSRGEVDRRSVNVSLTSEGLRILTAAPSPLEEHFHTELGKLQEWERTQMLATLQRIADMMHAGRLEAQSLLGGEIAVALAAVPPFVEGLPIGVTPDAEADLLSSVPPRSEQSNDDLQSGFVRHP